MLRVAYVGPPVLQPLLRVRLVDRYGERILSGRDLSTTTELGPGFDPQVRVEVPASSDLTVGVAVESGTASPHPVASVELTQLVRADLQYLVQIVVDSRRPFGNAVSTVYAVPLAHPLAPGVGDTLFVTWGSHRPVPQ
jgi:hypothetical protein